MTLYLSIDTETSGLPARDAVKGTADWPWIVQIGCVLFDAHDREQAVCGSRVRSDGRYMSEGAIKVHGITNRQAGMSGLSEIAAMAIICGFAADADYLIGFNVGFDRDVCESTLIRLNKETKLLCRPGLTVVDLIQPCAALCKLPTDHPSGTYRWPKLGVACQILLGEPAEEEGAEHNALVDAQRARRLFFALLRRGVLDIPSEAA